MSGVTSSPPRGARERSKPTGWDRTRLGVLVPLGVVVAVAIVCIVVAALTSAQRADDVALERERQLLSRAIANHAEWALLRLKNTAQSSASVSADDINQSPAVVQPRLRAWLGPLIDHDLVLVVDSAGAIVYSQPGQKSSDAELSKAAVSRAHALVEFMRGRTALMPAGAMRLLGGAPSMRHRGVAETVFLINIRDRLNLRQRDADRRSRRRAVAVPADAFAPSTRPCSTSIGERLQLANLRMVGRERRAGRPQRLRIRRQQQRPDRALCLAAAEAGRRDPGIRHPLHRHRAGGLRRCWPASCCATCATPRPPSRPARTGCAISRCTTRCAACRTATSSATGSRSTIADVKRAALPAAAVFYIDLDHFKDVNDTLGHPVGDELIRNVTLRLSNMMRGDDLVARLGGDEFAVITAAASDHATLQEIASRMIATLCAPYSIGGHTIVIGASIGIAVIDQRTGGSADIMRYADMALYRAKNEGRNRACIYDAVMDADLSQRKLVEQDLRETIENDGLKVLYQPIFNASGDKVVGVEALARWPHPTRGYHPADRIHPDRRALRPHHRARRQRAAAGLSRRHGVAGRSRFRSTFRRCSSAGSTSSAWSSESWRKPASTRSGSSSSSPRSTLLGNVESAEAAMLRLKALGVRFALDDFGTGYSSLLYLRRFPFDKLKIDRSFVHSIEKAADAAAIVHAVVSLGRGLGMKVTAEGVETAEQHLFLRAAGVHYMQGFRFGRPVEPAEIASGIATPGHLSQPRRRRQGRARGLTPGVRQSILMPIAVTIGFQRASSLST